MGYVEQMFVYYIHRAAWVFPFSLQDSKTREYGPRWYPMVIKRGNGMNIHLQMIFIDFPLKTSIEYIVDFQLPCLITSWFLWCNAGSHRHFFFTVWDCLDWFRAISDSNHVPCAERIWWRQDLHGDWPCEAMDFDDPSTTHCSKISMSQGRVCMHAWMYVCYVMLCFVMFC